LLTNIAITDGDSLKGVYKNELIKIRLAEIDAPELRQAFGLDSKNCLISLIQESNNEVFFKFKEKDRYDRHVGWIYSKNLDINLEMVKKGCAWVYDRYVQRKVLFKHQDNARENNIGLWKNSEAIAPWKWRRAN
jgi:micrococcal nuclease